MASSVMSASHVDIKPYQADNQDDTSPQLLCSVLV